jgi:trehalose/maltose hydrolase-like predicted phosphorylase
MWYRSDINVKMVKESGEPIRKVDGCFVSNEEALNLILRFHAFHLMQVASRNNLGRDVSIPARGLSGTKWRQIGLTFKGESYRGHIFWDELFILPFYHLRFPEVSRAVLLYRSFRLETARDRAKQLGCFGACFPWQSGSNGMEESQALHLNPKNGEWIPDRSSLQYHVNCAIFYSIL